MLTTSPVISSSANASPTKFRYGPARSPRSSPSRFSGSLPRRQPSVGVPPVASTAPTSTTTASIPTSARQPPRQYVAVDASTQYSPMEDVQTTDDPPPPAGDAGGVKNPDASSKPPPPPPAADTSAAATDGSQSGKRPEIQRQQSSQQPTATMPAAAPEAPATAKASAPKQSPTKRRNPDDHNAARPASSNADEAEPSAAAAKRLRPIEAPPKVMPLKYETCDVEDLVVLIARMLAELIETNDALALRSGSLTRFHSRTAPGISVLDYLNRLAKHATLTPPLLLSMVYYIDRLCALYPEFTINTLTVHRFLITAATVAAKGLSDSFWNNSTYARVGGVRVAELKLLELEFLYRVDWKIVPNPEVLVAYYRGLVERCPGYVLEEAEGSGAGPESSSSSMGEDGDDDVVDESDEAEDESADVSREASSGA